MLFGVEQRQQQDVVGNVNRCAELKWRDREPRVDAEWFLWVQKACLKEGCIRVFHYERVKRTSKHKDLLINEFAFYKISNFITFK